MSCEEKVPPLSFSFVIVIDPAEGWLGDTTTLTSQSWLFSWTVIVIAARHGAGDQLQRAAYA